MTLSSCNVAKKSTVVKSVVKSVVERYWPGVSDYEYLDGIVKLLGGGAVSLPGGWGRAFALVVGVHHHAPCSAVGVV